MIKLKPAFQIRTSKLAINEKIGRLCRQYSELVRIEYISTVTSQMSRRMSMLIETTSHVNFGFSPLRWLATFVLVQVNFVI